MANQARLIVFAPARAAIIERDSRASSSDGQLFVNAPCGPAGPVFTPTGGAFKSMPSPKVNAQSAFDYAKIVPKESSDDNHRRGAPATSSPSGVRHEKLVRRPKTPKTPPVAASMEKNAPAPPAYSHLSEGKQRL